MTAFLFLVVSSYYYPCIRDNSIWKTPMWKDTPMLIQKYGYKSGGNLESRTVTISKHQGNEYLQLKFSLNFIL